MIVAVAKGMQRVWYRRFAAKIQRRVCHLQLFRQPKVPVPVPVQENEKLFFATNPSVQRASRKKCTSSFLSHFSEVTCSPRKPPCGRARTYAYTTGDLCKVAVSRQPCLVSMGAQRVAQVRKNHSFKKADSEKLTADSNIAQIPRSIHVYARARVPFRFHAPSMPLYGGDGLTETFSRLRPLWGRRLPSSL